MGTKERESQSINAIVFANEQVIPSCYRVNNYIVLEVYQEVMWELLKHLIVEGIEPPNKVTVTKKRLQLVLKETHWWGVWGELGLENRNDLQLFGNTLRVWLSADNLSQVHYQTEILGQLSPLALTLFAFSASTCAMFQKTKRPDSFMYRPTELTEYWYKKAGIDRYTDQRYEELDWFWPFCDWVRLRKKSRDGFYRTFYFAFFLPLQRAKILSSQRAAEKATHRKKSTLWNLDPAAYALSLCKERDYRQKSQKNNSLCADDLLSHENILEQRLAIIIEKATKTMASQIEADLLPLMSHTANIRAELDDLRQASNVNRGEVAIDILEMILDPFLRNSHMVDAESYSHHSTYDFFHAKLQSGEWALMGKVGLVLGDSYDNKFYDQDETLRKLYFTEGFYCVTRPGLLVGDILLLKGQIVRREK